MAQSQTPPTITDETDIASDSSTSNPSVRYRKPTSTLSKSLSLPEVYLPPLSKTPPNPLDEHRKWEVLKERNGLSAYHPQHWSPTRIASIGGERDFWGVLYGIPQAPYLRLYRHAGHAAIGAQALESWRIFGGVLERDLSVFLRVTHAVTWHLWNRPMRMPGGVSVNLRQYLNVDTLVATGYVDVKVARESFFAEHESLGEFLYTVERDVASQLAGVQFGGDVTLDVALCMIWERYTGRERAEVLTPRERQLFKLWKRLPKRPTRTLQYHDQAPRYG